MRCFFHCVIASMYPLLWCSVPRKPTGYPKDSAYLNIEIPRAKELMTMLEERFIEFYGKDSAKVENMKSYMVEDDDMPVVCKLFRIRVRVTLDYALRDWHDERKWDRVWGDEGCFLLPVSCFHVS